MSLPLKVYFTKLTRIGRQSLRARAYAEVADISRASRHWKGVAPNAELLYPLKLFCSFKFTKGGIVIEDVPEVVSLEEIYEGRAGITFAGLLRALIALRAKYPEAYNFFIKFAKLFSAQVDSKLKVAPMHYLFYRSIDYFVKAWEKAKNELGITPEEYAKAIAEFVEEYPDIFEHVALFSPKPEVDAEKLELLKAGKIKRPKVATAEVVDEDETTVVVKADVIRMIFGDDLNKRKNGKR